MVSDVEVVGVTISDIGGTGVDMRGVRSGVRDSLLHDIGCRAAVVHGGNATALTPGHMYAINNTIHDFAQYGANPPHPFPTLRRPPLCSCDPCQTVAVLVAAMA